MTIKTILSYHVNVYSYHMTIVFNFSVSCMDINYDVTDIHRITSTKLAQSEKTSCFSYKDI